MRGLTAWTFLLGLRQHRRGGHCTAQFCSVFKPPPVGLHPAGASQARSSNAEVLRQLLGLRQQRRRGAGQGHLTLDQD